MFSAITRVKLEKKMCFMPNAFLQLTDVSFSCQFVIYLDYVPHALWTFGILED